MRKTPANNVPDARQAVTLHETIEKLQEHVQALEDCVRQRTRELEKINEALRLAQNALIQQERQTVSGIAHDTSTVASRSLRVLLIDDDPALLESLHSALLDEGHKVTTANGGQAGIDAFRAAQTAGKPFEIVITDLGMPYVDGRQVVASVRGMSPATPIILLTGWGQHVVNAQDPAPQVDRLLGKPPRIRELRAALADLTGRRATDRLG